MAESEDIVVGVRAGYDEQPSDLDSRPQRNIASVGRLTSERK